MMSWISSSAHRSRVAGMALHLVLVLGATDVVHAATQSTASAPAPAAHHRRHAPASTIDDRVRLMAHELNLNATQQAELKKILEAHRVQVSKVWSDASVPAAIRVSSTQAIGDRTADQIRALLTEEQRDKYIQPRQREESVGAGKAEVQEWMKAGQPK